MHMSVSCPCVCRKRVGLCAAVLHCPCPAGRCWGHLWSALWGQETPTRQHIYWHENDITNPRIFISWYLLISPLFLLFFSGIRIHFMGSAAFFCPPHFSLPLSSPHTTQLLTGCIYHPKEAQHPQSPGTAAAGLVVHKQAFHTTAKCVGVVSLAEPSQTRRVVEMFISDVQNESTTTSVKLLALISIGEIGRRRWAGTCGWGHLAMMYMYVDCGSFVAYSVVLWVFTATVWLWSEEVFTVRWKNTIMPKNFTGVPLGASFQGIHSLCIVCPINIIFIDDFHWPLLNT